MAASVEVQQKATAQTTEAKAKADAAKARADAKPSAAPKPAKAGKKEEAAAPAGPRAGDTVTVAEGKFKGKEGKIVQIVAGNPELKTPDLCVVKVNVASGAEFPVLPVTSLK